MNTNPISISISTLVVTGWHQTASWQNPAPFPAARTIATPSSAVISVGALVFLDVTAGMTEALITRCPSSRCTRNRSSATDIDFGQVQQQRGNHPIDPGKSHFREVAAHPDSIWRQAGNTVVTSHHELAHRTGSVMKTAYEVLPIEAASQLAAYKRAVVAALPGVERLILFGSRAHGRAHVDSDYDIAVVVRDLSDRRHARRILSGLAYDHVLNGFFIRPIPLPSGYLEPRGQRLTELAEDIVRDGVEVT